MLHLSTTEVCESPDGSRLIVRDLAFGVADITEQQQYGTGVNDMVDVRVNSHLDGDYHGLTDDEAYKVAGWDIVAIADGTDEGVQIVLYPGDMKDAARKYFGITNAVAEACKPTS